MQRLGRAKSSRPQGFAKVAELGQMLQCEPQRNVPSSAIREVTFTSGGSGGVMELGLLSNSSTQSKRLLDDALPPLFSGLALQPGVRTIAPPPVAWERRSEWGKVRSQVKALRRAVLDPAWRASDRRDSPCLVSELGRPPFEFRPRRVEAFVDQDRARRDGRTSRSVFHRLSRSEGGA